MATRSADYVSKTDIKLLILDIDGVINLSSGISKTAMKHLHEIIKATNCQIVLSSTWRKQILMGPNNKQDTRWFTLCKEYPFLSTNKFVADTPIIKRPPNPKIVMTQTPTTNSKPDHAHNTKESTTSNLKDNQDGKNNERENKDERDDADTVSDGSDGDGESESESESSSESESEEQKDFSAEYRRGVEIYQFIQRLSKSSKFNIKSWAAVDDMMLNQSSYQFINDHDHNDDQSINFNNYFKNHFVQTDVYVGISEKNAKDLIAMLLVVSVGDNYNDEKKCNLSDGDGDDDCDEKETTNIIGDGSNCNESGLNLLLLSSSSVLNPINGKYKEKCIESLYFILSKVDNIKLVLTSTDNYNNLNNKKIKDIISQLLITYHKKYLQNKQLEPNSNSNSNSNDDNSGNNSGNKFERKNLNINNNIWFGELMNKLNLNESENESEAQFRSRMIVSYLNNINYNQNKNMKEKANNNKQDINSIAKQMKILVMIIDSDNLRQNSQFDKILTNQTQFKQINSQTGLTLDNANDIVSYFVSN